MFLTTYFKKTPMSQAPYQPLLPISTYQTEQFDHLTYRVPVNDLLNQCFLPSLWFCAPYFSMTIRGADYGTSSISH